MGFLKSDSLPFIFLAIAAVFLFSYLRHLRDGNQRLVRRNRLRLMLVFSLVGGLLLLWNWRQSVP